MEFDPVWISTVQHLDKFAEIISSASPIAKVLGFYSIPDDFPQMRNSLFWGLISFQRFPVVAISSGAMHIYPDALDFQAGSFHIPWSKTYNLQHNLSFSIPVSDIVSIEKYQARSPLFRYYDLPYTRVQTEHQGLLEDFLVCVGGTGPFMGQIRQQSDRLFEALDRLRSD